MAAVWDWWGRELCSYPLCFYKMNVAKRNAGIGLSLCATIIHAHGGEISAENLPNSGAVFRFTMNTEENTDE